GTTSRDLPRQRSAGIRVGLTMSEGEPADQAVQQPADFCNVLQAGLVRGQKALLEHDHHLRFELCERGARDTKELQELRPVLSRRAFGTVGRGGEGRATQLRAYP